MRTVLKSITHSAFAICLATVAVPLATGMDTAHAASKDKAFFDGVAGVWKGPGEIVAGKYKGTKFTCNLTGEPSGNSAGITMDGRCRVGVFSQPMSAVIKRAGRSYKGAFLDGAAGKGLDIVSGNVTGKKVVVGIKRKELNGAMIANMIGPDKMNVTISVRVGKRMIPVIGATLTRKPGQTKLGALR